MPSQAQSDLDRGFDVLLDQHAEVVTFRGKTLSVVIDRAPGSSGGFEAKRERNMPDFSEREASRIALRKTAVTPVPRVGESFTDAYSHLHQVKTVEPRGEIYYLNCKVVGPAS